MTNNREAFERYWTRDKKLCTGIHSDDYESDETQDAWDLWQAAQKEALERDIDESYSELRGMTLRDYFAAKAMQGIISDTNWNGRITEACEEAYIIADAMLKAREAQNEPR